MAKQISGQAKFQIPGGQATPAPPVGTALGRFGINLGQFVQQFNDRTKDAGGMPIPVVVNVYNDRTFDFVTKSPPAAALLKKADLTVILTDHSDYDYEWITEHVKALFDTRHATKRVKKNRSKIELL